MSWNAPSPRADARSPAPRIIAATAPVPIPPACAAVPPAVAPPPAAVPPDVAACVPACAAVFAPCPSNLSFTKSIPISRTPPLPCPAIAMEAIIAASITPLTAPVKVSKIFNEKSPPKLFINPRVASIALYPQSINVTTLSNIFPPKSIINSITFPMIFTIPTSFGRCGKSLIEIYPRRTEKRKFLILSKNPSFGADGIFSFPSFFSSGFASNLFSCFSASFFSVDFLFFSSSDCFISVEV